MRGKALPPLVRNRNFESISLQQRVGRTPRGSWLLHTSVRFGLTKNFTLTKRVDDVPVWSLSCFYVRKGYRRKGVTETLIGAALSAARCAKAPALEAYPLDAELRARPAPAMPRPSPAPGSKRLRAGCRLARLCATIWRETGAKRGDFRLQTATICARSERVDTGKSTAYPLRLPLPRLGSGMGSCFHFLPRRLQYLRQDIFNRLRRDTSIDESQACARPSFARGTDGSNPPPSSADLALIECCRRLAGQRAVRERNYRGSCAIPDRRDAG